MNIPPPESPVGKEVMTEAGKALDSLSTLSVQLACQRRGPPHALVLSAGGVMEACMTIDQAVDALKRILRIGDESGIGPVPPQALQ
jgi:hypothetical protein